jgi:hypothetical protein
MTKSRTPAFASAIAMPIPEKPVPTITTAWVRVALGRPRVSVAPGVSVGRPMPVLLCLFVSP